MQKAIIGTKNQVVIPKALRQRIKGFKAGGAVQMYALDKETIAMRVEKNDWLDKYYGSMKEAWKNLDVEKEIQKMRDEWDERIDNLD